jgi:tetratricopeptide (TPR) repeat protein
MTASDLTNSVPPPPQVGRTAQNLSRDEEPRGLWSQLLTVFRDLSGAFDAFANDADPQVRALGRAARSRPQPLADDFFQIGDLCARLTPQGNTLSQTYAAKTIAAYIKAGELAPEQLQTSRRAMLAFTFWAADAALALGRYEALQAALLLCERMRQISAAPSMSTDADWLNTKEAKLREELERTLDGSDTVGGSIATEHESRRFAEQAQMLLRQGQPAQALQALDRSLQLNERNHAAWLWRSMALTDMGRFNEALSSYDRALDLEPESAGVWNNKGALLLELGRLEPALACFERALELSTAVSTVKAVYWLNKGKTLYMLNRYIEARDALVRSHELDPSPESAAGIAACHERLNTSEA